MQTWKPENPEMPLIMLVMAALALFLFLTLGARKDPDRRKQFYLYVAIDIWLGGVLVFLLVTGIAN